MFIVEKKSFKLSSNEAKAKGADGSNVKRKVNGNTNTMALHHAKTALAASLDLKWTVQGGGNNITAAIDVDGATNFMDIDGDDNVVTFDGVG